MGNILDIILQNTFVKNTALKKTTALKDYLLKRVFSKNQTPLENTGNEDPVMTKWVLDLDPAVYSDINPQNIYAVFDNLEKSIKDCEPLIIYLPYELPEEQIIEIGQKLRTDYGKNFLMDIQIDPGLIAGVALSYKGIYKDTSVKQRIMDQRKEVLAEFRKYIKH